MKIKNIIHAILLVSIACISYAQNDTVVLKQGFVTLTLDDIDGFALTIPEEDRAGFFSSVTRIDRVLITLLNMKHIQKYANDNDIVDEDSIYEKVNYQLINKFSPRDSGKLTMQKEIEMEKLKKYLYLKETYNQVQSYVINLVRDEDVIELAKEHYMLNKPNYTSAERLNIEYFALPYNELNKDQQIKRAKELKQRYKELDYDLQKLKNETKESDIEYVFNLNNFINNKKYPEFSAYVFKQKSLGITKKYLDANSRIMIINIKKITPKSTMKFDEVKQGLLTKLKRDKAERDFSNIITNLTKEKVTINQELLISLKNRY